MSWRVYAIGRAAGAHMDDLCVGIDRLTFERLTDPVSEMDLEIPRGDLCSGASYESYFEAAAVCAQQYRACTQPCAALALVSVNVCAAFSI